ncbi:glycosyltransferase family 39 protein [Actinoplanes utahensis]|uniref:Glycosyltransferase n=1 Tax=Actinoplanes utahensis TaxID=1869 RepID=A0A0A6X716_ACTUT|nr:phospholipid carrier-dependent glycosyltransferase [Actinoplanes utahensis]KHD75917.1 glycosyltransferase [Actinoplanes utahensis]GIF35016.1 glycosyl transferase [Actinoplanes utahensis]
MPRRRLFLLPAVVAMLGQMAFAMVTTAMQQSPTIDEPVYVATAEVYRQQHSLRLNPEHPPLGKLIIAAGTAFAGAELDPAHPGDQTRLGRHLLYENGNNPFRLMLLARLPVILLTLLFGLVVLAFARDLAGAWAGLIALALYSFSPDVIAHGSLATLDVPAAGFLLTAFWLAWRAREHPGRYVPLAGAALGAALATRMSALPAVPLLILLLGWSGWVGWRALAADRKRRIVRAVGAALGAGVIAVAVVWFAYLVVDPRLRWTTPPGLPDPRGLKGLAVDLLPFPQAYRDGMLVQFSFENKVYNGFLLGEAYRGSPWYYMPVAILIKTPLGMLAMWLAGAITMVVIPRLRAAALHLLPVSLVLVLVTMSGARNYGTRYVIVLPMFLAVAAGTVALIRRMRWPAAALVLFVAVSSLLTFPNYLPYSNEAFGGTANTHRNLHDANVDWGQDLPRLGRRLRTEYPGEPVWLVYKGAGVPGYYGIEARDPFAVPLDQVRGLLVVSDSRVALASPRLRQMIESSTLIDQVGHSISIYRR